MTFIPTNSDIERYLRLRAAGRELNGRITKIVTKQAFQETGTALGILRKGVLCFETEEAADILMDCAVHDRFEDGRNIVQQFAEANPAEYGTDEHYLLNAFQQARHRILKIGSAAPGAGVYCEDVRSGEELFLIDVGLSGCAAEGALMATRTIPLGDYCMSSGASLPIHSKSAILKAWKEIGAEAQAAGTPGRNTLLIVRTLLAAGSAEHVRYETSGKKSSLPPKKRRRR